jgi:hypothetical protein
VNDDGGKWRRGGEGCGGLYAAVEWVPIGGNGPSRRGVVAAETSGMGGGREMKEQNICIFLALVADRAGMRNFLATRRPLAPCRMVRPRGTGWRVAPPRRKNKFRGCG